MCKVCNRSCKGIVTDYLRVRHKEFVDAVVEYSGSEPCLSFIKNHAVYSVSGAKNIDTYIIGTMNKLCLNRYSRSERDYAYRRVRRGASRTRGRKTTKESIELKESRDEKRKARNEKKIAKEKSIAKQKQRTIENAIAKKQKTENWRNGQFSILDIEKEGTLRYLYAMNTELVFNIDEVWVARQRKQGKAHGKQLAREVFQNRDDAILYIENHLKSENKKKAIRTKEAK